MEEVIKYNPHHDSRGRFTSGGGGGGLGPDTVPANANPKGHILTRNESKRIDDLAIDMFNHKQTMPLSVRTGKKSPAANAYRQKFTDIVDEAARIMGTTPREAHAELNRRMGVGG